MEKPGLFLFFIMHEDYTNIYDCGHFFPKFYQVLIIYLKSGTFSDVFLHWNSSNNMMSACKQAGFSLII